MCSAGTPYLNLGFLLTGALMIRIGLWGFCDPLYFTYNREPHISFRARLCLHNPKP